MPTYTYHCDDCGNEFDIFQHFTDDSLEVCPKCKEHALRKVYTPVGIVFKGSGFYATDHRSPSGMNHAVSEVSSESTDSGQTEKSAPAAEKADVAPKENKPKKESKSKKKTDSK